MYAVLCDCAANEDHCWPSQASLAERLSCSVSSVKNYLAELVREKLIIVRREQYRSSVYYLLCPDDQDNSTGPVGSGGHGDHSGPVGVDHAKIHNTEQQANAGYLQSKAGHEQPKSDRRAEPKAGYLNNLKKQENKKNPPLPPVPAIRPSFSSDAGRAGGAGAFPHDFETLWEAYPRKEAVGLARAAWRALQSAGELPPPDILLSAVRRFKATESWQRENGRYIPQMSNWLRGHRWLDPLPSAEARQERPDEMVQAYERQKAAAEAAGKAERERLQPSFAAFAEKFRDGGLPNIAAMAFGTWRFLHAKGLAPAPADVPDDNALGIMEFMRVFRGKCQGSAFCAGQVHHGLQASAESSGRRQSILDRTVTNSGKAQWAAALPVLPMQRKSLCAGV
jgi:hypothetical protein